MCILLDGNLFVDIKEEKKTNIYYKLNCFEIHRLPQKYIKYILSCVGNVYILFQYVQDFECNFHDMLKPKPFIHL